MTEPSTDRPWIAVIGGSGFYEFLDEPERYAVETPYGPPSDDVSIGWVDGRRVAFLPRHGREHAYPPHRINYRANLWALRSVGVRRVIAPCAVGSLRADLGPGSLVVPDQLVDRTSGRVQTFTESGAVHVGFADPYCPELRAHLCAASEQVVDGGTMVVVEGPRFSTRAESHWFADLGWTLVNMTGHPEAVLARELAMCYAALALVTDRDAGITADEAVSQVDVFAEFERNIGRMRRMLRTVVAGLPDRAGCRCRRALDGMPIDYRLP